MSQKTDDELVWIDTDEASAMLGVTKNSLSRASRRWKIASKKVLVNGWWRSYYSKIDVEQANKNREDLKPAVVVPPSDHAWKATYDGTQAKPLSREERHEIIKAAQERLRQKQYLGLAAKKALEEKEASSEKNE